MKTIIITGCANGIGNYLFENFDRKKYDVYGIDKELVSKKNTFKCDISNIRLLDTVTAPLDRKPIDAIINVAGVCPRGGFHDFLDKDFDEIINNNVKSTFNMCKMFVVGLILAKGSIINISSVHAKATLPGYAMYAMTKGAVEAFTRGLAIELAETGVRANCIRLGAVKTSMLRYKEAEVEKIPLQCTIEQKDILSLIGELIENKSITGGIFTLDCGMTSKLSVEM